MDDLILIFAGCLFHRDMKIISTDEYKKLVDQCVQLAHMKIQIHKMENALEKKSDEIIKLKSQIRRHNHMHEKELQKDEVCENQCMQNSVHDERNVDVRIVVVTMRHY